MRFLVSNPTTNAFVRALVTELARRDLLDRFHTTLANGVAPRRSGCIAFGRLSSMARMFAARCPASPICLGNAPRNGTSEL
jgi:hypothetical protein